MRDAARLGASWGALALALIVLMGCERRPTEADAGASTLLTIGEDGVGDLTSTTPFSREALEAALPAGFALEESRVLAEGDTIPTPILYAFHDGHLVLEISPDANGRRIERIDAASARVEGPHGLRPGIGFAEARGDRMRCAPGRGDLSGRAVCSPGSGPLRYVFAHGGAPTPEALPDDETMQRSILERIVWMAP
ncbi:MAG: DUF1131 family protein [Bacteroidota bacterium]